MHGRYRGGDVYQVSIPLIYRHFLHAFMNARVQGGEKVV